MNSCAKITVLCRGVIFQVAPGESLFQVLTRAGISLRSYCGSQRICGKCRVRLIGNVLLSSKSDLVHLSSEEVNEGIRLACDLYPNIDMAAEILETVSASESKLKIEGMSSSRDPWREHPSRCLLILA